MGKKSDPPPAPNYTPIADASRANSAEQNALAREQFEWAKNAYAENKITADKVANQFLDTQDENFSNAKEDRARYENLYQPLEDKAIAEANDYATAGRTDLEMGKDQATVNRQFQAARTNAQRDLEAFGINPGATRFAALDIGARTQQAATEAGAGNLARDRVENTRRALRSEAINIGRGYPGQVAGTSSTGLQAGSGAVNVGNTTTQVGGQTMGTAPQYYAGSNQSLGIWGNTLNQGYQNAMTAWNASQNQSSGWGSALGAGAGLLAAFVEDGGTIGEGETPGGAVPAAASPTSGQAVDDVPAALTVGEFVMPKDTVSWYGEKKMHDMIVKAREDRAELKRESGAIPKIKPAAVQRPAIASRPGGALPVRRIA